MARHISVYRATDLSFIENPPKDVNSSEFDAWSDEAERCRLYSQPLGSEDAIRQFWSNPGVALGLPMVASIYDKGFYEGIDWSGEQLDQVEGELDSLEGYWDSLGLEQSHLTDLRERLGFLRMAIRTAQQVVGILTIV